MITGVAGSVLPELPELSEHDVSRSRRSWTSEPRVVPQVTARFPALGLVLAGMLLHVSFVRTLFALAHVALHIGELILTP